MSYKKQIRTVIFIFIVSMIGTVLIAANFLKDDYLIYVIFAGGVIFMSVITYIGVKRKMKDLKKEYPEEYD